jgi:hypothetical protein
MDNKMNNNINIMKDSDTKEIVLDNFGSNSNLDIGLNNLEVIDLDSNLNTSTFPKPNLTVHNSSDIITIPEINSTKKGSSLELGLDLLANQNKKKTPSNENISLNNFSSHQPSQPQQSYQPSLNIHQAQPQPQPQSQSQSQPQPQPQTHPQIQRPPLQTPNQGMKIDIDNLETINLDNDIGTTLPQQPSNPDITSETNSEPPKEKPINMMSTDEIMKEKTEILSFFDRLEKRGVRLLKRFNLSSNLEDMRYEKKRIIEEREAENSIKFQRKMMMAFITGLEFLNNRYDPFDIKLDGWSESVHENVNDYDEVFEELHEKYKEKTHIAPELKLMLMLGGSAFMFHLTSTMFKTSLPGMNDIMQQNPDLMKQFANAAMSQMGNENPGFSNLMSDVNGGFGGRPQSPPPPPQTSMRRDMDGPKGVDEILASLNTNSSGNMSAPSHIGTQDINSLDSIRNVDLNNKMKKSTNSITLDL